MGVALRTVWRALPGGNYFSRAIVDREGAPITNPAVMGSHLLSIDVLLAKTLHLVACSSIALHGWSASA